MRKARDNPVGPLKRRSRWIYGDPRWFSLCYFITLETSLIVRHTTVSCITKEKETQAGAASKRHLSKIGPPPKGLFPARCREGTKLALRTWTSQDSGRLESEFALTPWPKNTTGCNWMYVKFNAKCFQVDSAPQATIRSQQNPLLEELDSKTGWQCL